MLAESANGENWFLKGGDFRGAHFSPLSQVNADNVESLGLAWAADLPIPDGISTTPIVVDGVIYLSGAYSVVFAVDASNGDVLLTSASGDVALAGMHWHKTRTRTGISLRR